MARCRVCGRPRGWTRGNGDFVYLPLPVAIYVLVLGCLVDWRVLPVSAALFGLSAWGIHYMRTTDFCYARPEWGETCSPAKNPDGKDEVKTND